MQVYNVKNRIAKQYNRVHKKYTMMIMENKPRQWVQNEYDSFPSQSISALKMLPLLQTLKQLPGENFAADVIEIQNNWATAIELKVSSLPE